MEYIIEECCNEPMTLEDSRSTGMWIKMLSCKKCDDWKQASPMTAKSLLRRMTKLKGDKNNG